jgi:hypothetical protein
MPLSCGYMPMWSGPCGLVALRPLTTSLTMIT